MGQQVACCDSKSEANGAVNCLGDRQAQQLCTAEQARALFENGTLEAHGDETIKLELKPEEVYNGQFQTDMRHGEGELKSAGGDNYFGQFDSNFAHGVGVLSLPNGSVYDGEFSQDHANGRGVFTHLDGTTYEGEWLNDRPHGEGTEVHVDSSTYTGRFEQGMKHGIGQLTLPDRSVYEGDFHENLLHGSGQMGFPDGRIYNGQWRYGELSGIGECNWPKIGDHYVGGYCENRKHGSGRYEWADGSFFEGEWRNGVQHGIGCFGIPASLSRTGESQERIGVWADGVRLSWIDPVKEPSLSLDKTTRTVRLRKSGPEERFGFMYSTPKGGLPFLVLSRILPGGLLHNWNADQISAGEPHGVVDVNSRIMSVNGVSGDCDKMKQELQTSVANIDFLNPIHRRLFHGYHEMGSLPY